jgi:chromosome segregation ATPase
MLITTLQARPDWYDWPWGAVGAISIVVTAGLFLLRLLLKDQFISPGQFRELKEALKADAKELQDALEADIAEVKEELRQYEQRCDGRTSRFEEKLERGFVTVTMLNGVGDRIDGIDGRMTGITTLFTQTRERADEAYQITRDLQKDLTHFMGRIEEKISTVADLQKGLQTMNGQLESLTRILAALQASIPSRHSDDRSTS